jgi:polysaccharide biosynthesis transport protein
MFKVHFKRIAFCAVIGLFIALWMASTTPKVYQSSADVLVDAGRARAVGPYNEDVANLLVTHFPSGFGTEVAILRSKRTFADAYVRAKGARGSTATAEERDRLYMLYKVGAGRDNGLVQLVVMANNPSLAADIANQIPLVYNETRARMAEEGTSQAREMLQEQVDLASKNLQAKQNELQRFKEQHQVADIDASQAQIAGYAANLSQEVDRLARELQQVDAELRVQNQTMQALPDREEVSESVSTNPRILEADQRIANLYVQKRAALQVYTPTSKRVRDLEEMIANEERARAQIVEQWVKNAQTFSPEPVKASMRMGQAQNQVRKRSLEAALAATQNELTYNNNRIKELPAIHSQHLNLVRDVQVLDGQYRELKQQLERFNIRNISNRVNATIHSIAEPSETPVAPDMTKMAFVGLIAGLCVGVLGSFLFEALRLPVRTSGQLSELSGLPVAATIPLMPRRRAAKMLASLPDPDYRPGESFRFMAFSLLAKDWTPPKVILFTGIGGSVGCSSSAGQLAVATAKTGVKTVLVDCDLRHPALTAAFELEDRSGISDMLNRTLLPVEGQDLSVETDHKNLLFVPAGADGATDLAEFPTSMITGIIDNFKQKGDVIVLDAPPCDIVSDAARLVPYVDEVCLVVSATSTSYRAVPIAYDILKRCGAKNISLILTHASPQDEPFSKKSRYLVTK